MVGIFGDKIKYCNTFTHIHTILLDKIILVIYFSIIQTLVFCIKICRKNKMCPFGTRKTKEENDTRKSRKSYIISVILL